ncbi:GroES-like protein [Trichoderma barbatum]
MKEAIVLPSLEVEILDSQIPIPGEEEVIIRVVSIGLNPIDWKGADPEVAIQLHGQLKAKQYANPGKDVAGYVHAVGSKVHEFKPGDRVQATNHGSGFAEYSVSPRHTTYLLPDSVSFDEGPTPLVIYGAASSVGAFAVKLASLSNIHPIYAVAGRGTEFVESLLDSSKGDLVIDYRKGPDFVTAEIQRLAPKLEYALDAISTPDTSSIMVQLMDPVKGRLSSVLPTELPPQVPAGIKMTVSFAPALWEPSDSNSSEDEVREVTTLKSFTHVYFRYLSDALANNLISHHPFEVVDGGFGEISRALKDLRDGKNSASKYVVRISG